MHIAIILYLYSSREETLVLDLGYPGKGEGVEDGDILGLKWNGYAVAKNKPGPEWGSNKEDVMRAVLGDGSLIDVCDFIIIIFFTWHTNIDLEQGWEIGLRGIKRGQRRLLVVPSHLSQRTQAPYPQNEGTFLYAVTLDRVKRNPNKSATSGGRREDDLTMMPLPDIGDMPEKKTRRQSTAQTPTRRQERYDR